MKLSEKNNKLKNLKLIPYRIFIFVSLFSFWLPSNRVTIPHQEFQSSCETSWEQHMEHVKKVANILHKSVNFLEYCTNC